jgi:hypothetical protein
MANAKTAPAPRRSAEAAKIVEAVAPAAATGFARRSISIDSELEQALRAAAIVDHRTSVSQLVEVALRQFLALPLSERTRALAGASRRRKAP